MTLDERLIKQFNYFGMESQQRKLCEEVNEFVKELILWENGIGDIKRVIDELVDVEDVLRGIQLGIEIEDEEKEPYRNFKMDRTDERIRTGYYKNGNNIK